MAITGKAYSDKNGYFYNTSHKTNKKRCFLALNDDKTTRRVVDRNKDVYETSREGLTDGVENKTTEPSNNDKTTKRVVDKNKLS